MDTKFQSPGWGEEEAERAQKLEWVGTCFWQRNVENEEEKTVWAEEAEKAQKLE